MGEHQCEQPAGTTTPRCPNGSSYRSDPATIRTRNVASDINLIISAEIPSA